MPGRCPTFSGTRAAKTLDRCDAVASSGMLAGWRENFAGLKLVRAEIDDEPEGKACHLEVVQGLGQVFRRDGADGLEFNDKTSVDDKVCDVFAKWGPVFVADDVGLLGMGFDSSLLEAVDKSGFIDVFEIAIPEIDMKVEGDFSDLGKKVLKIFG